MMVTLFLEAFYPIGVTEILSYFTQIFEWIPTKANFNLIGVHVCVLWQILQSMQKINRKKTGPFAAHISVVSIC